MPPPPLLIENLANVIYTNTLFTMTLGEMQPYLRKPIIQNNIKFFLDLIIFEMVSILKNYQITKLNQN